MNPEEVTKYMEAFTQGITNLASQMKQPVEQVYEIFYRQNYVNAGVSVIQIALFSVVTYYFIKFLKWGFKEVEGHSYNNWYDNEGLAIVATIVGTILTFGWLVVMFDGVQDILSRFINPHYMTIKDIVELIKPKQ